MKINIRKLFINVLIPVLLGGLVGLITGAGNNYDDLIQPSFAPPSILFPVVWTILYVLMGISSYIISIIGNIIPVPFILLLIAKILDKMRNSKVKAFNKFAGFLDSKVEKHKGGIEKYGYWGVVLFVGIPLPGTGAWTGSLIASVLELDKKKTFAAVLLGIFIASIIMMLISFGFLANIIK